MDMQLKGKNAAVVGATRGIGLAIADLLASEGCNVSICARSQDGVDAVVNGLSKHGVKAMGSALDATDAAAQTAWIDGTAEAFGGLDIFIANVSALNQGTDEAAWKQGFEVDIMATFYGAEAAVPHLKNSDAGAIVMISSIAALHVPGGPKPYGAMKAAVINYAKGLARACAGRPRELRLAQEHLFRGWRLGKTERNNPEFFAKQIAANPMGRMGTPDEVAKATVLLASPAASFVSGTNLLVEGALTLGVQCLALIDPC